MQQRKYKNQFKIRLLSGFTLLELSVVVTVIAVVTAMGMSMGTSMLDSAQRANTEAKLTVIENALMAFRLVNERLPCPADLSLTSSSSVFGAEAATPGTCTGGSPAANNSSTNGVVEGAVPVRTLNLPDEYMFDGWGRKFNYAVWKSLTAADGFYSFGVLPYCGKIKVYDASGGYRTQKAVYALVSFGPDGHGGYLSSGSRMSAGSINTDERTNCHCDGSASATGYAATYVQKDGTLNSASAADTFDDIVRFKERWQMQNSYDTFNPTGAQDCTIGFRIDSTTAGEKIDVVTLGDINNDGKQDIVLASSVTGKVFVVFGRTDSAFSSPLLLSSLDGSSGFTFDPGVNYVYYSGGAGLAPIVIGDVDGDGINDLVIGGNYPNCSWFGRTVVIFGRVNGWAATYTLASADGTNASVISGNLCNFSWLADINNDGKKDIITGGPAGTGAGTGNIELSAVFGSAKPWPASINATTVNGVNGFRFSNSGTGGFLSSIDVGDVNGDLIEDVVIGLGWVGAEVYVLFGKPLAAPWPAMIDINVPGVDGTIVRPGPFSVYFGTLVRLADINGDSIKDILIGDQDSTQCGGGAACGSYHVIFGNGGVWPHEQAVNIWETGGTGFTYYGSGSAWQPGCKFRPVDINGDGKVDLLNNSTPCGGWGGWSIHFGKGAGYAGAAQITAPGDGVSFSFISGTTYNVLATGDINGDTINDLLMIDNAASPLGRANAGSGYVYFGRSASPWAASIDVSTASGTDGFSIYGGTAGDQVGSASMAGLGVGIADISGSSSKEMVLCAPLASYGAAASGSCFVIFGKSTAWSSVDLNDINTQ